jgi:hypothetical protein
MTHVDNNEKNNIYMLPEASGMVWEDQDGGVVEAVSKGGMDQDQVSMKLQQVYEYILNDQRPEAVGQTEELAQLLDIEIERPPRYPGRERR